MQLQGGGITWNGEQTPPEGTGFEWDLNLGFEPGTPGVAAQRLSSLNPRPPLYLKYSLILVVFRYQADSLTTVSSVPLSDQGSMKSVNVSGKMEIMDASAFMSCPVTKEIPKCDDTTTERIRTMDGSCNNKANPHWGMSNMPLLRSLPSEYGDGK